MKSDLFLVVDEQVANIVLITDDHEQIVPSVEKYLSTTYENFVPQLWFFRFTYDEEKGYWVDCEDVQDIIFGE